MKLGRLRLWIASAFVAGCPDADEGQDTGGSAEADTAEVGGSTAGDTIGPTGDDSDSTAGDSTGGAEIDCDDVPVITYDTFGAGFLATYCNGCHGSQVVDRQGAPDEMVFDTRAQASAFGPLILNRRMPPEGVIPMPPAGGVTPDDDIRLEIWLTCFP